MNEKPDSLEDAIEKAFESYANLLPDLNDIDSADLSDNIAAYIRRHFDVTKPDRECIACGHLGSIHVEPGDPEYSYRNDFDDPSACLRCYGCPGYTPWDGRQDLG